MTKKRVAILYTGIVRPSPERVYNNICNTISYLTALNLDISSFCLTYDTQGANILIDLLKDINIAVHIIPFIKDAPGNSNGNQYRMMKTNELLVSKINNLIDYDIVLRMRIDCELAYIEIPDAIEQNVLYAPVTLWNDGIFDNLSFCVPSLYRQIWNTEMNSFSFINNEKMLEHKMLLANATNKPFNFKLNLYQSSDPTFMGIPQWSKANRIFEYKNGWIRME
jgi:hypothetical protein